MSDQVLLIVLIIDNEMKPYTDTSSYMRNVQTY